MTLLRLEFFKGRRRKIAILCLACLGIQTAWMVVNLLRMEPEELSQGWMQLVYTLLLVDAITLPLTMAALASRTCELEHLEALGDAGPAPGPLSGQAHLGCHPHPGDAGGGNGALCLLRPGPGLSS